MRRMGFCDKWINLMMICVKTITYSILVNGEPHGLIQPTRKIRQGDPLSPFLFLLCTEGLHGLITKAVADGDLRGFSISKEGPKLTHMLFADDILLFCRSNELEFQKLLNRLGMYEAASGKKINKDKKTLFFFSQGDSFTNEKF